MLRPYLSEKLNNNILQRCRQAGIEKITDFLMKSNQELQILLFMFPEDVTILKKDIIMKHRSMNVNAFKLLNLKIVDNSFLKINNMLKHCKHFKYDFNETIKITRDSIELILSKTNYAVIIINIGDNYSTYHIDKMNVDSQTKEMFKNRILVQNVYDIQFLLLFLEKLVNLVIYKDTSEAEKQIMKILKVNTMHADKLPVFYWDCNNIKELIQKIKSIEEAQKYFKCRGVTKFGDRHLQSSQKSVKCFNYHEYGHISRNCSRDIKPVMNRRIIENNNENTHELKIRQNDEDDIWMLFD